MFAIAIDRADQLRNGHAALAGDVLSNCSRTGLQG
jgi:hypothetical protein